MTYIAAVVNFKQPQDVHDNILDILISNGDCHHTIMHSDEFVPPEDRDGIDTVAAANHQGGVEPYLRQEEN